jgi:hypothetical protein
MVSDSSQDKCAVTSDEMKLPTKARISNHPAPADNGASTNLKSLNIKTSGVRPVALNFNCALSRTGQISRIDILISMIGIAHLPFGIEMFEAEQYLNWNNIAHPERTSIKVFLNILEFIKLLAQPPPIGAFSTSISLSHRQ